MRDSIVIIPSVRRRTAVEESDERQSRVGPWNAAQLFQHFRSSDVVVGADAVQANDHEVGVQVRQCCCQQAQAVGPSSSVECELVGRSCSIELLVKLLGQGPAYQAPQHLASSNAAYSAVLLPESSKAREP